MSKLKVVRTGLATLALGLPLVGCGVEEAAPQDEARVESVSQALCGENICASAVVTNGGSGWQDDHPESTHTPPPEDRHNQERALYPFQPVGGVGGATAEPIYVTIYWRSYHRAMNRGSDGGHCGSFCSIKDATYSSCVDSAKHGYDGLGLQPDESGATVHTGGATAMHGCTGWLEGPYQNNEGKWEWPEIGSQSALIGDCSPISGTRHDWTSRPVDIVKLTYKVSNWNGLTAGISSSYQLRWDEDDSQASGGNEDLDFTISTGLPGLLPIGKAIDKCLQHGSAGQRFTLQEEAALMLCENPNLTDRCDDHLFETFFDVQCQWQKGSVASNPAVWENSKPAFCFGSTYVPLPKTAGSCVGNCGGSSDGCFCDTACAELGDCCSDYKLTCL